MSTPEVEVQAREIGWLPKEEFRGNPEHWRSADEYIKRGEEFIPFIQADRKKLQSQLTRTEQQVASMRTQLAEASETIEALKEFRSEMNKERVQQQTDKLVDGIAAARERGDIAGEEQLREKLATAKEALKEPEKKPPADKPVDYSQTPEWQGFLSKNPWWNTDAVMRGAAVALMQDMIASGQLNGMTPEQRFDAVAKATLQRFSKDESTTRRSAVEGGRQSGGAAGGSSDSKQSFNDLPSDVKDAASHWEARLVGPKKAFKDLAAFRANYANEYFRKNPNG